MTKSKILAISLVAFIFFNLGASLVQAAGFCESCSGPGDCDSGLDCLAGKCQYACPANSVCIPNPLKACSFEGIIDSVINFIFYVALAIAPLMVLYGAFNYLTSAGEPAKITKAQDIILYTAIGFAIILLSKGLVAIIRQVLGA